MGHENEELEEDGTSGLKRKGWRAGAVAEERSILFNLDTGHEVQDRVKLRNSRLPGSHRDWQLRPRITTQQWGGAKAGTEESRCSSTEAKVTETAEGPTAMSIHAQKPHKSGAGQDEDGLWDFLLCKESHGI